jgi:hypothetical protein
MDIDASTFLSAVIPELKDGWFIEVRSKNAGGHVYQDFCSSPEIAVHAGSVRARQGEVWFGVGLRLRRRGTKADVGGLGAVWADQDFKHYPDDREGAARALWACPLEPSIVVASGGGFQPYWLLNEMATPAYFARIEAINRGLTVALAPEGQKLDAAVDAARVLRLPGTRNLKYSPPREVRIVTWQPERRYGLTDLEDVLPRQPAQHSAVRPADAGGIGDGERNSQLTSLAGSMRRRGMTQVEIAIALHAVNAARCSPPLSEAEVDRIAASVVRYAPAQPFTSIERAAWARARRFA